MIDWGRIRRAAAWIAFLTVIAFVAVHAYIWDVLSN